MGIGNVTHSTAISSGNQEYTETSIPEWPAYPNDKLSMYFGFKTSYLNSNKSSLNVKISANLSDVIRLDKSKPLTLVHNSATVATIPWSEVVYDESINNFYISSDTSETLDNVIKTGTPDDGYQLFVNATLTDFSIGDYNLIPINLRTEITNSLDNETYVSGVTSRYTSDYEVTGSKNISNLTSPDSGMYNYGDEVCYQIDFVNKMHETAVKNYRLIDNLPKGFDFDTTSIKVVDINGEDVTDITNEITFYSTFKYSGG